MSLSDLRIVSLLEGFAADSASFTYRNLGVEPVAAGLPTPTGPDTSPAYVAQLTHVCDILLLPLGLEGGASLTIARESHRQRAPFRMVLFTGSRTATPQTTVPLFDCLSSRSMELFPVLRRAALAPVPPRISIEAADRQIARLIEEEYCFRTLRPVQPWEQSLSRRIVQETAGNAHRL